MFNFSTIGCNLDLDDKVKKRFPTLSHLSDAGILTDHERKIIEDVDAKCIQVCHLIVPAALL